MSLTSFALTSPSSRTSPRAKVAGCALCGGTCTSLATIRPLWLFRPLTSAPLIDGRASSSLPLWPTVTVTGNDNRAGLSLTSGDGLATAVREPWPTPMSADSARGSDTFARGNLTLTGAARQWPTPTASEYGSSNNGNPHDGRGSYATKGKPSLAAEARQWATPTARDDTRGAWKGESPPKRGRPLTEQVAIAWGTPTASMGHKGTRSKIAEKQRGRLDEQIAGSLNPEWVEMLMGFPRGWTDISGPPAEAPTSTPTKRPARSRRGRVATEPSESRDSATP